MQCSRHSTGRDVLEAARVLIAGDQVFNAKNLGRRKPNGSDGAWRKEAALFDSLERGAVWVTAAAGLFLGSSERALAATSKAERHVPTAIRSWMRIIEIGLRGARCDASETDSRLSRSRSRPVDKCSRDRVLMARRARTQGGTTPALVACAMESQAVDAPLAIAPELRRGALRRRNRRIAAIVLVVIATVVAIVVFRNKPEAAPIGTTSVERRTITRKLELTGHLDVTRRVEVPAEQAGRLESVLAPEGKRVTRGEALAELDDRAVTIEREGAEAGVEAADGRVKEAVARLEAATESLERVERLRARELASDAELESARADEARAKAAAATARAERSKAQKGLRSATIAVSLSQILAPVSGIVLKAPQSTGGAVGPEVGPLFVIGSDLAELRIDAEVSESEVGELRQGQPATFTVPAYSKQTFRARVERIGIDAQRSNGAAVRYPVELRADNSSGLLRPAMTATVTVPVSRAENVLAVRDAALRYLPEDATEAPARSRVWLVNSAGELEQVPVEAGLSDGAFTEIRPRAPGALRVGAKVALGPATTPQPSDQGPGIKLGNR